jgi:hypothetical protein
VALESCPWKEDDLAGERTLIASVRERLGRRGPDEIPRSGRHRDEQGMNERLTESDLVNSSDPEVNHGRPAPHDARKERR